MIPSSWLIHTCTRAARTGVSSKGDPTYGAQSSFLARVEKQRRLVPTTDGKTVQTNYVLVTTTPIEYDDRIWLPSIITGDTSDDASSDDEALLPVTVEVATDKIGNRKVWIVRF